jgi:hypothetical protein
LHLDFCLPCWHRAGIWRLRKQKNKSLSNEVAEAGLGWVLWGEFADVLAWFPINSSPAASCSFSFRIPLSYREHKRFLEMSCKCLKCALKRNLLPR